MVKPIVVENFRESIIGLASSQSRIKFEIWHIADGLPIGDIALSDIEYHDRNAEVGVIIGEKSYWGQGYATEALEMVIRYAFEEINLHKLIAKISAWNLGSEKAFQKAGFYQEATLKEDWFIDGEYVDTHVYALFHRDWNQRKKNSQ